MGFALAPAVSSKTSFRLYFLSDEAPYCEESFNGYSPLLDILKVMNMAQTATARYPDGDAMGRSAMKLSQELKGRYYKGLLVLLRRDRIVHNREKDLMLQIGEILGFDKRFCEATMDELLSNTNITRDPVLFPDEAVKECFLRDAVRLALIDDNLHPSELRWLQRVAHVNGFTDRWLDAVIGEAREKGSLHKDAPFEIEQHL
jgi:hypothetical protein